MENDAVYHAQKEIRDWLFQYGQMHNQRNQQLVNARRLGLTIAEISQLTGMSRQHLSRVIHATGPGRASSPAGTSPSHPLEG